MYHTFNLVFTDISYFMKLCDLVFTYLTYRSSLELSKVIIAAYAISATILIFIGLSHLAYFNNFRSSLTYIYYISELIILAIGVFSVINCLVHHTLNQLVIRASNEDRKNRYNLNKQIERQFKPGVIRQIRQRVHDAIFEDPEEE